MNATSIPSLSPGTEMITLTVSKSLGILIGGLILGKIVEKSLEKIGKIFQINKKTKKIVGINLHLEEILPVLFSYSIYFFSLLLSLDTIGIAVKTLQVFYWIIIIVLVISFLLALKEMIPNVIHGIALMSKGIIKEGDLLILEDIKGYVEKITLTNVILVIGDGESIYLPFSLLAIKSFKIKREKEKKQRKREKKINELNNNVNNDQTNN